MPKASTPEAESYSMKKILKAQEGVLTVGRARAVVMTEAAYVFLLQVLHEHAPHAIKYAFYDMGYRVGEELMRNLEGGGGDPEGSFRYLVEVYRQSGYGNMGVDRFDLSRPEVKLSGTNLFESGLASKSHLYRTPRCVDHYSRGIFAGFMSNLLGREVVCEEIRCEYRGDPKCEFVVLPFEW